VPPTRYDLKNDHIPFTLVTETGDPSSNREAIKVDDHGKSMTIMEQEKESLDRNQKWKLVVLSKDSKAIDYRWVFRKKDNEQYKIRLVDKGYAQKEGIDYNKIFSLVIKHTSIQMLLAMVDQFDLKLE